jgi:hypothetical protein
MYNVFKSRSNQHKKDVCVGGLKIRLRATLHIKICYNIDVARSSVVFSIRGQSSSTKMSSWSMSDGRSPLISIALGSLLTDDEITS